MKVFTNENNPATLKLLLSASVAKKNVVTEIITADDKRLGVGKRLPVLELADGTQLFSANAAARLLFPPDDDKIGRVDEWLEFEATRLLPTILNGINAAGKIDNSSKQSLLALIATLEETLNASQYLAGESLSVADVCVWSSLHPLISDLLSAASGVKRWHEAILGHPAAQQAVQAAGGAASYTRQSCAILPPVPCELAVNAGLEREDSAEHVASQKETPLTEEELEAAREAWLDATPCHAHKTLPTPVLPVKGERNILITSALPYVNNIPHLGNIIGCVLSADVFARFCRLRGDNTLFICGTDEYGTATETKAIEEGLTPQQICDKYFAIHSDVYQWFNISFDHFGRTTTQEQTQICQKLFLDLHKNGLMSTQTVEQLLCQKCDRYLADRFVEGTCPTCKYEDARGDQCDGCGRLINAPELIAPRCKMCSAQPVLRHSEQFFLDLPKVEERLATWLDTVVDNWSHNARVITRSWLKDGLRPRCITRDLKWGIPVPLPEYSDKVFYVWFDAPIGYISMTACYTDQWRRWWQPQEGSDVALYQFMAKDNVPFHSVMFPACLIGAGQGHVCVSHLMATEYLNYEDGKFSKSRGVGVFGTDARATGIPADVWRFYLLSVRPEAQDASFSWADLAARNNSELLNNLGNFVNRALVFAEKNFDGVVPRVVLDSDAVALLAQVNRELVGYVSSVRRAKLRAGAQHILAVSRHGNQYMQAAQPWVLVKGSKEDREKAGSVIALCCNISCLLAALLHPYMPATAQQLRVQLNAPDAAWTIPDRFRLLLPEGHRLGKPAPLFTKIEMLQIAELKKRYAATQKSRSRTPEPAPDSKVVSNGVSNKVSGVAALEASVAEQAEVVRSLKAGGASKADVAPHVAKLLQLKAQLATEKGEPAPVTNNKKKAGKK